MGGEGALPLERRLREASDSLVATLDELYVLEEETRRTAPGSARFVELASRVESLARAVLTHSRRQEALASATATTDEAADPEAIRPIEAVPPRSIQVILAEWRAVERELDEAEPGSEAYDRGSAAVRRLREEYRRAWEAARSS